MMKTMEYVKIILALLLCAACSAKKVSELDKLVNSSNKFSIDLFKRLYVKRNESNMVVSPLSVFTVLAMASDGADENTLTKTQILKKLRLPLWSKSSKSFKELIQESNDNRNVSFSLANKVCVTDNLDLKPNFQSLMKDKFLSPISLLNSSDPQKSAKVVNDWVSQATNGKITNIISEDDIQGEDAFMLLLNAVYFKADWKYKFDESLTKPQPWYYKNSRQKFVETMQINTNFRTATLKDWDVEFIELPYKNEEFKMIVVVPSEKTTIRKVVKNLNLILSEITRIEEEVELKLSMPKFKIEYSKSLIEPLKKLGMTDMFSAEASFKGIANDQDFKVKDVRQKAYIEVNEQGSEAAAVTEAHFMARMAAPPTPTFEINRPSIFLVMKNNLIIFMGYLKDPEY